MPTLCTSPLPLPPFPPQPELRGPEGGSESSGMKKASHGLTSPEQTRVPMCNHPCTARNCTHASHCARTCEHTHKSTRWQVRDFLPQQPIVSVTDAQHVPLKVLRSPIPTLRWSLFLLLGTFFVNGFRASEFKHFCQKVRRRAAPCSQTLLMRVGRSRLSLAECTSKDCCVLSSGWVMCQPAARRL